MVSGQVWQAFRTTKLLAKIEGDSGEASRNRFGICRKRVEFHIAICDLFGLRGG